MNDNPPWPMLKPSQNTGYSRATRNTPATTIVELCSSDDTGVGPAIASGSHVCSGNWPDLPMQAMNRATAPTQDDRARRFARQRPGLDGRDVEAVAVEVVLRPLVGAEEDDDRADEQADVADAHGEERLQRRSGVGLLLPPVPDQHERAQTHDLPAEDDLDHVLGENHDEHARREQGDGGEEVGVPAIAADVVEAVDLDEQRDERHGPEQHHRQAVDPRADGELEAVARPPDPACARPARRTARRRALPRPGSARWR